MPAMTFIASALAVIHAGAIPVLCDVQEGERPDRPRLRRGPGRREDGGDHARPSLRSALRHGRGRRFRREPRARGDRRRGAGPRCRPARRAGGLLRPCRRASASIPARTLAPSATAGRSAPTILRWPSARAALRDLGRGEDGVHRERGFNRAARRHPGRRAAAEAERSRQRTMPDGAMPPAIESSYRRGCARRRTARPRPSITCSRFAAVIATPSGAISLRPESRLESTTRRRSTAIRRWPENCPRARSRSRPPGPRRSSRCRSSRTCGRTRSRGLRRPLLASEAMFERIALALDGSEAVEASDRGCGRACEAGRGEPRPRPHRRAGRRQGRGRHPRRRAGDPGRGEEAGRGARGAGVGDRASRWPT